MTSTEERESLEELIGMPGWHVFVTHVIREWKGEGYQARMASAFAANDQSPRIVHEVSKELLRILQWPRDRIGALKGQTE